MSGLIYHTDKRRIIPQIEYSDTFSDTFNVSESLATKKKGQIELMEPVFRLQEDNIKLKIEEWIKDKSTHLAGDILSQAIVDNQIGNYASIKNYLIDNFKDDRIIDWLFVNRDKYKGGTIKEKIEINYRRLKHEPGDSITWTDQAINFIQLNDRDEALSSIEKALKINKDLGFIVRNAARIFGLTGDNGRSIKTLKNSENYKYDPQIVSAEIAYSQLENRKTYGVELGNKLIIDRKYNQRELSELASALGTFEMLQGDKKRGERLFDISMISPNKNSLAQYVWYKEDGISLEKIPSSVMSNETKTHLNYKQREFTKALHFAKDWINEEPYSLRPYMIASHLTGSLLRDYDSAFMIMKSAKDAQMEIKSENFSKKDEIVFGNDLAYFLLKANKVKEAEEHLAPLVELHKLSSNLEDYENVGVATLGLYAYKMGDPALGKKFYRATIKNFIDQKKFYLAGSAFVNFIEEELEVTNDLDQISKLLRELEDLVPDEVENDLLIIKKSILDKFRGKLGSR